MKTLLLLFITIFAITMNAHSQDLSSHQWEDRLILILTDDTSSNIYQKQIEELHSDQEGLEDRKLVIYTILPNQIKRNDIENSGWIQSGNLYSKYKKSEGSFEILLIGLDGGVKLRQSKFLSNEDLFGRIDQMPMRRNELRNRGDGT
ncbi:DUF4174 domain-containing protein [Rhodohalobacter sulfatireducens]|uniref:DUF4174 domain-containing protein n=1 Tax=Rhodohalobacter sulfatireducens TaxID=2911366 RepID=A0ABS9KI87_9BACT|nr:DUF4174 domain-containing protein [Rhodohalobacter sulfatireducens]MCG2590558.1 DUF4174 domain-containing protein [Rhodohalobacter sulfatireducens]